jgi:phage baseplate assembly protein gpV
MARNPDHLRSIRTPEKLELAFDDSEYSITITNPKGARVTLASDKIELVIESTSVTVKKDGDITLKAKKITLDATKIEIKGENIDINGTQGTKIKGGTNCSIDAAHIDIG